MLDRPLVSILINNYNYGRFLKDAIDSALNQTYARVEVIVVDDGSTDESRSVIAAYGDRILPVLKQNEGQATAFDAGLKASKGEIICLLDADDTFQPDKIARIVQIFQAHPQIGWCFHRLQLVDVHLNPIDLTTSALPSAYRITNPEGRQGVFNDTPSQELDYRDQMRQGNLTFDPPPTSGLCFSRSLLSHLLPMPLPAGQKYNYDGYLKFSAAGLSPGYFLDEELAGRRMHGSNDSLSDDSQRLKARYCVLTAYGMRQICPDFATYASRLLARGIGTYWRAGELPPEAQTTLRCYLRTVPLQEKLLVGLRTLSNLAYGYWSIWKPAMPLSPRRVLHKPL